MGGLVADDRTHDVGMEQGSLDLVERTERASPEAEHLASIMLENTELMAPNPAGDGRRLGGGDDEHSE
jgi:hypothetical protein